MTSGTVRAQKGAYACPDVPATFDIHRLTEGTTLIIVAGSIDYADVKAMIAVVAVPLSGEQDLVISFAQCTLIDIGAIRICERVVDMLAPGQCFVVVIDDRNASYELFFRDRAPVRVTCAPTISAAVRTIDRQRQTELTGT